MARCCRLRCLARRSRHLTLPPTALATGSPRRLLGYLGCSSPTSPISSRSSSRSSSHNNSSNNSSNNNRSVSMLATSRQTKGKTPCLADRPGRPSRPDPAASRSRASQAVSANHGSASQRARA